MVKNRWTSKKRKEIEDSDFESLPLQSSSSRLKKKKGGHATCQPRDPKDRIRFGAFSYLPALDFVQLRLTKGYDLVHVIRPPHFTWTAEPLQTSIFATSAQRIISSPKLPSLTPLSLSSF
ncbi:hypothetical protein TorRG33x02_200490 [Trema orientale]|uniref:Uncharacterized protein n=1 Tax=Trema orientale TaxID=63057 RepID=A0A2P5EF19_TREOI|nr:hypothetical protein TorRG33x02_200490 [Trema orientale]